MKPTEHSPADAKTRKRELEHYFAQDLTTLTYPLLADIYFQEGNLDRARKVCEIGLERHPGHAPGLYLQARIAIREGKLEEAERWLEQTLDSDSTHVEAAELLVALQERLKRSPYELERAYRRLVQANPLNRSARSRLERARTDTEMAKAVRRSLHGDEEVSAPAEETVEVTTVEPTPAVEEPEMAPLPPEEPAEEVLAAEAAWRQNIEAVAATLKEVVASLARDAELEAPLEDMPTIEEPETPPLEVLESTEEEEADSESTVATEQEATAIEVEVPPAAPEPEETPVAEPEILEEEPAAGEEPPAVEDEPTEPAEDVVEPEEPAPPAEAVLEPEELPEQVVGEDTKAAAAEPEEVEATPEVELAPEPEAEELYESIEIDPKLATFTLATIYKVQGLYQQALQVLDLLERKGADSDRIKAERESIQQLIARGHRLS
jgi:tetratricopeptide (TPR) repeat protein